MAHGVAQSPLCRSLLGQKVGVEPVLIDVIQMNVEIHKLRGKGAAS